MARPQRSVMPPQHDLPQPAAPAPASVAAPGTPGTPATDRGYGHGGLVGQMHADLARRLDRYAAMPLVASPEERLIRFLSVGAGFVALLAGYATVALLVLR